MLFKKSADEEESSDDDLLQYGIVFPINADGTIIGPSQKKLITMNSKQGSRILRKESSRGSHHEGSAKVNSGKKNLNKIKNQNHKHDKK